MANQLDLSIGADVSGLIAGLTAVEQRTQQLESRLASFQRIAGQTTDLNRLKQVLSLITTTQSELNRIQSAGIPNFGRQAVAANELEKRIRVATSAEHEFNAILGATPALLAGAENPAQALGHEFLILATGIQRAKEAGQTFSQISTTLLGSIFSLQGAITLGTALLFGFGKEIFGTGKKAKDAVDPIEALGKSVAEEAAKLTATVGLIENANTSNEDRAKALKAVNEQYGPLLKSMGIEEVTLGNIKAAYDTLIDSMLRRAVVKGLEDQIAEQVKKTATEIIKLKEAQENERIAEEKRAQAQKDGAQKTEDLATSAKKLGDNLRQNQKAVSENTATFLPLQKQQADAAAKMHDFDGRVNALTESLKKQLAPLLSLTDKFSDLELKFDKTKPPKLTKEDFTPRDINALLLEPETELVPKINAKTFESNLEKAVPKIDDFHIKLGIALDTQVGNERNIDKIKDEINRATSFNKILDLEAQLHIDTKNNKVIEGITEQAATAARTVNETLTPAFQDLFTAIEQGGNPLKAFFKGIERAIEQLIAKLIAAVVEAEILNIVSGGVIGTGANAAKGFGGILQKILGFAEGGHVAAGGRAVGHVTGPGSSRSDSIPAMLSNGEFVMKAAAVQKYGVSFMNAINQGQVDKSNSFSSLTKTFNNNRTNSFSNVVKNISNVKHFADGGLVTNFNTTSAADLIPSTRVRNLIGGQASGNINVTVNGEISGDKLKLLLSRIERSQTRTG